MYAPSAISSSCARDETMASSSKDDRSEGAMRAKRKAKKRSSVVVVGGGINLDVTGAALAAQAAERIEWHTQVAAEKAEALAQLPSADPADRGLGESWKREELRRQLRESLRSHEEHARFLEFVRRHLRRRQIYRLSLQDLSYLEITPKGRYA
jgi:hypothetical protein